LIEVHRSVSSFAEVNSFEDYTAYKRRQEKAPKYLVIFDDCINDTDKKSRHKIAKYTKMANKYKLPKVKERVTKGFTQKPVDIITDKKATMSFAEEKELSETFGNKLGKDSLIKD
jgi:hypothetical protein